MPYLEPNEHVRELRTMDRLLTAEEVAERLGMRTDWVWAQARAGLIPHIRLGRYRRFRESAVEAWLREIEAKSTVITPAAPTPLPLRRRA
jgi:excisionase family DNA binding protein